MYLKPRYAPSQEVIPTKETTYKLPSCPASLALLSDLHNTDPAPILSSLRSRKPSLICITGDVLYGSRPEGDVSPLETQTNVLPFLAACASSPYLHVPRQPRMDGGSRGSLYYHRNRRDSAGQWIASSTQRRSSPCMLGLESLLFVKRVNGIFSLTSQF